MPTLLVSGLGLTGIAGSIASALIGFAISYAIQKIFAPDEPEVEAQVDQGVQARIPTNPKNKLPVVYGEQRVAGQNVMADISSDNQRMAFIIALSEGSVEAINRVTWEDKVITFDGNINTGLRGVTNTVSDDGVNSGFLNGNLRCQVFPAGGRCSPMESFSSRWNSGSTNRLMPNTAYAYIELTYNRDERVTGLPSRLFFNVRGRTVDKLQSDGTLNSSTTMSTNPVDNLLDFLTDTVYGCSIPESGLDLPSFYTHKVFCDRPIESEANNFCSFVSNATTVANGRTSSTGTYGENDFLPSQLADASEFNNQRDCEDATAFSGSTSVSATWQDASTGVLTVEKPRYSTNGVLNTNNELDRSISDLTVGNGGIFTYNLGKFGIVSEGERSVARRGTTAVSFSEDDIIGKLDITGSGFDAVINECTLKFTSIRQKYQQEQVRVAYDQVNSPLPNTVQNPNEPRLEQTMQLPFTNNDVEARRIGRILINDSRQALIVSFKANINNTDLQAGDIIEVSHDTPGWTNKLFRIQQVDEKVIDKENMSIGVAIIAREYAPEVYTSETLLLQDPAPNTNFPNPLLTPALTLVTSDASGLNDKGIPVNRIRVDWSTSTTLAFVDTVDVRIHKGNVDVSTLVDTDWEYYATTSDSIVISEYGSESISESTLYQIQVRPRNTLGALGTYVPLQADKSGTPVLTASLDSIFEVEVILESNTGGTVFKNGASSTEKELTATVTKVTETDATLADHNTFNYLWKQDGDVICIDSSKNVVGVTTGTVQDSQAQCESAGGDWDDTRPATFMCHTTDSSGVVFPNTVTGCTVGDRADTDLTGFTITSTEKLRTIVVQHDDVDETAGFSCEVSNIELT